MKTVTILIISKINLVVIWKSSFWMFLFLACILLPLWLFFFYLAYFSLKLFQQEVYFWYIAFFFIEWQWNVDFLCLWLGLDWLINLIWPVSDDCSLISWLSVWLDEDACKFDCWIDIILWESIVIWDWLDKISVSDDVF